MKNLYIIFALCSLLLIPSGVAAQDPALPSANFGFNNLNAGHAREPGWYYAGYLQTYNAGSYRNVNGHAVTDAPLRGSITSLQQLTWITDVRVLNGRLGFTTLIPIVKNTSTAETGQNSNPDAFGDLLVGPFAEWKKAYKNGAELDYRFGVNFFFPTGSWDTKYTFNPSAHRYRIFPHLECTFAPIRHFAVSVKNNLYFYSRELGSPQKAGTTYNLNYAVEYRVTERLTLAATGYYLKQLGQDSYNGDDHYYQDNYGVRDTREKVFALGPGLGFRSRSSVSIELKAMWETSAMNRPQGFRSNLLVAFPL